MTDESTNSNKKHLVIGFISSFLGTIFVWAFFLSFVFGPDYFIENSFPHKYVANSADAVSNNPRCLAEIGHLVSKGVIVDAKEIWAFQGNYYSALITILIAVLGLLGAVAFFYIKTISLDKVQEFADISAKEATKQVIGSFNFVQEINNKIEDGLTFYGEKISKRVDIDEIEEQISAIHKRLNAIETAISASDDADSEGADLKIKPRDDNPDEGNSGEN